MNSLKTNSVIYKIQDLVIQKELASYKKFQICFQDEVKFDKTLLNYKFLNSLFKNIYTFLKELQKHPKSIILVQALRPLFEMVLFEMIIPDLVNIFKMGRCEILYNVDITKTHQDGSRTYKRMLQIKYNLFVDQNNVGGYWPFMLEGRGIYSWVRKQRIKRVETIGVKAFIKETEERRKRSYEKFINWREQLGESYITNFIKFSHDAKCGAIYIREEYKDYLKYSGCDLNEDWMKQFEEFEKKHEKVCKLRFGVSFKRELNRIMLHAQRHPDDIPEGWN